SEGGLGVALAEMSFAGRLGAVIRIKDVPLGEPVERDDLVLFSESNSRFLVAVAPENRDEFEETMGNTRFAVIGKVSASDRLQIYGWDDTKVVDESIRDLREAWQRPIRW
ncbi:MAG: phosphoribosylformylglycinamidine synthase, partial [Dehalococcoidia bacterium]|nr:phosphoribosylformylglycinamidine synthase [Dehalococcoidia bacterium]